MDDIKDIVNQVISDMSSKKIDSRSKIQQIFKDAVGKTGIKHARVAGLKDDQVLIHVDSPAALFQMNMKKSKLLEKFNKENLEIKKISFKIGKIH